MIGDYMKTVNRIRIFCILTVLTGIMGYQLYTRQSAKEENIVSSTEEVARVEYIKETEEENILPVSQGTVTAVDKIMELAPGVIEQIKEIFKKDKDEDSGIIEEANNE